MAGEIPDLHAQERTGTGKGAARAARRDGMVPGIVFGGDVEPLPVNIPFNVLLKRLKQGRFKSTLFNLKVDGHDDVRVICRDVQRDVVKDLPTHFDLMRLALVPVEFINEDKCEALTTGVLTVIRNEIELVVTAGDIPESITVDLSLMEAIGDTITISQVELPEGAKPTIDRDFVICNIAAPSALKSDSDDEEDEDVAADEVPATEQEAGPDSVEEAEGGEG